MDTNQLIKTINTELQRQADPSYRELVRTRYNMRVDNFWGVRTPTIHQIAGKHYKEIKGFSLDQRLEVCQQLLTTGIYEHKIMAFRLAHLSRKDFDEKHLEVFAHWLDTYGKRCPASR
jgi:hypothetical protein